MKFTESQRRFSQQLTEAQPRLYAYIMAVLPDADAADEVLQRANVVILEKADRYDPAADFTAWACKVAYYEVLGYRRDRGREHARFDEASLERIADAAADRAGDLDRRRRLLRACMAKLTEEQRTLLLRRYQPGESVQHIADDLGRPVGSISQTLYRIRRLLVDCVREDDADADALDAPARPASAGRPNRSGTEDTA